MISPWTSHSHWSNFLNKRSQSSWGNLPHCSLSLLPRFRASPMNRVAPFVVNIQRKPSCAWDLRRNRREVLKRSLRRRYCDCSKGLVIPNLIPTPLMNESKLKDLYRWMKSWLKVMHHFGTGVLKVDKELKKLRTGTHWSINLPQITVGWISQLNTPLLPHPYHYSFFSRKLMSQCRGFPICFLPTTMKGKVGHR